MEALRAERAETAQRPEDQARRLLARHPGGSPVAGDGAGLTAEWITGMAGIPEKLEAVWARYIPAAGRRWHRCDCLPA
jgi:hypothetical protein